jgi:hypothetical protein
MNNQETKPQEKIKYYGDCPDGTKNKLFSFSVYNLQNSIDMLNKFVNKGGKIRKAWHHYPNGQQRDLRAILPSITGDLSDTYSALKELDKKLNEKQR